MSATLCCLLTALFLPAENPAAAANPTKLWAGVTANSPVLRPGEAWMLQFDLVNEGQQAVDADLFQSQLLINGEPLKDWDFIIGNGPKDGRWKSLPAGESILFGYALADRFEKPGVYRVVWQGKGFRSAETVFRVLAKP